MTGLNTTYMGVHEFYEKGRPSYPAEIYEKIITEFELNSDSFVADIGCGTGLFSSGLIKQKINVIGVEPSKNMLHICMKKHNDSSYFTSTLGSAENTGLKKNSVDLICAAQSFHWFNWEKAQLEFKRICRSVSNVPFAIIYNERNRTDSDLGKALESLLLEKIPAYHKVVAYDKQWYQKVKALFEPSTLSFSKFSHLQELEKSQFFARMLSSSFSPKPESENQKLFIGDLENFYKKYNTNRKINIEYNSFLVTGLLH